MWCVTFCHTLTRRFSLVHTAAGFVILYVVLMIPACWIFPFEEAVRTFYPVVIVPLALLVLFRDKWYKLLFMALICLAFMFIADVISCLIVMTPEQMREGVGFQPSQQLIVAYALCISMNAFLLWMLTLFMNRYKNPLHFREWMMYLLFPLSQYMLMFGWLQFCKFNLTPEYARFTLIAILFCLAADIALFVAFRDTAQRIELKAKNELLSSQLDRQLKHYSAITAQYENIRRMRHDIAKHLYTMQALLQSGRYQDASAYSGEVAGSVHVSDRLGVCENPVVDAYLYSRAQELERGGCRLDMSVQLPEYCGVANADLIVAFANLIDNAEEACRGLEDRTISLAARVSRGYLSIETSNACAEPRAKKRRVPELERGIGFAIFQELARKYQGSFDYKTENGRFSACLILKGEPSC